MARLWKHVDGEPFLINPSLTIINPKKRGGKMAARRKRRRRATPARRRISRRRPLKRNAYALAGPVIGGNPRRRRRRRSAKPRLARGAWRRRVQRNPKLFGITLPPLQSVVFASAGFIAPPMLEGFLGQFMPVEMQTNVLGKYALRIASVLGLTWITKSFVGASEAKMVALGGSAYVLTTAVSEFAPDLIPGMSAYVQPGLSGYIAPNQPTFSTIPADNVMMGANRFNPDRAM